MIGKYLNNSAGNSNIKIVQLTTTANMPDALTLTELQQSQLNSLSAEADASRTETLRERLRSEIEIGLEQLRTGDTVDGETVFANLRTRIDSYREPK